MPLTPSRLPFYRRDGGYILFCMEDEGKHVPCAVSLEYIAERAYADQILTWSYPDLFDRYRLDIERLASQQYDSGAVAPVISPVETRKRRDLIRAKY
jgi:hypothetical protein